MSDANDALEILVEMARLGRQLPATGYTKVDRAVGRARVAIGKAATIAHVAAKREKPFAADGAEVERWLNRQSYGRMLLMSYGMPPVDMAR